MSDVVIKLENVSKQYRLGEFGTGTLSHDLNRWWHRVRGKEDPYLKIGAVNDRATTDGEEYVWALHDINLEVKQGEVLGIIGKNGAGKSTLLKLLSRVTAPTTGKIMAKGRVASLLEVGTGFHPELTGKENIYLNGAILGMTKAEVTSKLDEIVEFAGVARYLDTPVKRYSSGMKVRLGFAVAAHLDPEVLIVDEVLAVGDAEFQKRAVGKIKDVSRGEGRTVLFVSHNMASVGNLCTKTILLENGKIALSGNAKKVISDYLQRSSNSKASNEVKRKSLSFYRRDKVSSEVVFSKLLINGKLSEIPKLAIGENVLIDIWFNSDVAYKGLLLTINILNDQLQNISSNISLDKGQYIDLKRGINKYKVLFDKIKLVPGKYYLSLGISRSISSRAYDVLLNVPAFEITSCIEREVFQRPDRPGFVLFNMDINPM